MTDVEVTDFLGEPGHLLRLGTTDASGAPSVVPIWFVYEEGRILFTPRERSAWRLHLERDPRVCLLIDESAHPYRKVVAKGDAVEVHRLGDDNQWRDIYRRIMLRYVPEEWGAAYQQDTIDEPRALYTVVLEEASVSTWRMPLAGEDPLAVWAPRYYHR
jgi:nitroimidazol reductase NimA-like FMN-containing flavoprotein (pyridoxamine 5'-phosphate oxidase superfamily)